MEKENQENPASSPKKDDANVEAEKRSSKATDPSTSDVESSGRGTGTTHENSSGSASQMSDFTSGVEAKRDDDDDTPPSKEVTPSCLPQLHVDPGSQSETDIAAAEKSVSPKGKSPGKKSTPHMKRSPYSMIKVGLQRIKDSLSPKKSTGEEPGTSPKDRQAADKSPNRHPDSKAPERSGKNEPTMLGDELKHSESRTPKRSPEKSARSSFFRGKSKSPGKADKSRPREETEPILLGDELRQSTSSEDDLKAGDRPQGKGAIPKVFKHKRKSKEKSPKQSKDGATGCTSCPISGERYREETLGDPRNRKLLPLPGAEIGKWSTSRLTDEETDPSSPAETDVDMESLSSCACGTPEEKMDAKANRILKENKNLAEENDNLEDSLNRITIEAESRKRKMQKCIGEQEKLLSTLREHMRSVLEKSNEETLKKERLQKSILEEKKKNRNLKNILCKKEEFSTTSERVSQNLGLKDDTDGTSAGPARGRKRQLPVEEVKAELSGPSPSPKKQPKVSREAEAKQLKSEIESDSETDPESEMK